MYYGRLCPTVCLYDLASDKEVRPNKLRRIAGGHKCRPNLCTAWMASPGCREGVGGLSFSLVLQTTNLQLAQYHQTWRIEEGPVRFRFAKRLIGISCSHISSRPLHFGLALSFFWFHQGFLYCLRMACHLNALTSFYLKSGTVGKWPLFSSSRPSKLWSQTLSKSLRETYV